MIDQVLTRAAAQVVQSRKRADVAASAVIGAKSTDGLEAFTLEAAAARKAFKASAAVFSAVKGMEKRMIDTIA